MVDLIRAAVPEHGLIPVRDGQHFYQGGPLAGMPSHHDDAGEYHMSSIPMVAGCGCKGWYRFRITDQGQEQIWDPDPDLDIDELLGRPTHG